MKYKILITDPISEKGIELFNNEGMEVLYKPESSHDEINNLVHDIDAWIVRSGTKIRKARQIKNFKQDLKVNKELFEMATELIPN